MNYPKKCLPWEIYWNLLIISESDFKITWKNRKERMVKCLNKRTWKISIYWVSWLLKWDITWVAHWTHYMYNTDIYKKYGRLKERCNNPKHISYKNYWWRWIKCEWNTFEEFFKDMWKGYIKGLSVDRIDNNWNYCKDNCRWATKKTQSNNTRRNIFFEINGIKKTLKEWCDEKWLKYHTVFARIKYYWKTFEEALY